MTQDEEHLNLLSVFHYVVAGLAALFACFPLIHLAIGLAMLFGAFDGKGGPPRFAGVIFVVVGGMFILCGWALAVCIFIAARMLAQRKARTYCLVVAAIECMFMPFGTVLGVLTLIMLMKDSVKELFDTKPPTRQTF